MDLQKKALAELQAEDDALKLERRKADLIHVQKVLRDMETRKKNLEKFCEDNHIELTDALGTALLDIEYVKESSMSYVAEGSKVTYYDMGVVKANSTSYGVTTTGYSR